MNTIGDRIKQVRKDNQLTIVKFSERIGISNPAVSMMETGKSNPSDQTIRSICREFKVNEIWLRTGEGDMLDVKPRAEELGELVRKLLADRPESFRSRLITSLLRFEPDSPEWQILENIYDSVATGKESRE